MRNIGDIRIGISGWRYRGWRGVFYPPKMPQRRELAFCGETFGAVEINGTFYSLQRPEYFERWAAEVPDDFVFAIKGPRFVTHNKKLNDVEAPLANFFASGILKLGAKLGPFLWQLPPMFRFNPERLARFFEILPRDSEALARFACRHDQRVAGRACLEPDGNRRVRHCLEIRHKSFEDPRFIELLRDHDIGLVCADTVDWPLLMDVTSDFVYCRLHGSEQLYVSGYESEALERWADRVAAWAQGGEPADAIRVIEAHGPQLATRDVYVFFDNDVKVRAPFDAIGLAAKVDERLR